MSEYMQGLISPNGVVRPQPKYKGISVDMVIVMSQLLYVMPEIIRKANPTVGETLGLELVVESPLLIGLEIGNRELEKSENRLIKITNITYSDTDLVQEILRKASSAAHLIKKVGLRVQSDGFEVSFKPIGFSLKYDNLQKAGEYVYILTGKQPKIIA